MKIYDNIIPVAKQLLGTAGCCQACHVCSVVNHYFIHIVYCQTTIQSYNEKYHGPHDVRITGFYICVCCYKDNIRFFKSISFPLEI